MIFPPSLFHANANLSPRDELGGDDFKPLAHALAHAHHRLGAFERGGRPQIEELGEHEVLFSFLSS